MVRKSRSFESCLLSAVVLLCSCLPEDTRATPGSVVVTVSGDEALGDTGFSTTDGWTIVYERFLIVVGEVELDGESCEQYSDGGYSRALDLTNSRAERVSLLYGLGRCDFSFRVGAPSWDTVSGAGVSEADLTWLRTPGTDAHADEAGISILVEGRAQKLGTTKRFSWSFRRYVLYSRCESEEGEPADRGMTLESGQRSEVALTVLGGALFSEASGGAVTRFQPFSAADDELGDADGEVTLAELVNAPRIAPAGSSGAVSSSLGEWVYLGLLPDLIRYPGGGSCTVHASAKEPEDERGF